MKISMFSTQEMKYIWYLLKKVNFLLILYFLEDSQLINLLTMLQGESQYCRKKRSICDRIPGSIDMVYSHQDLQIKREIYSASK